MTILIISIKSGSYTSHIWTYEYAKTGAAREQVTRAMRLKDRADSIFKVCVLELEQSSLQALSNIIASPGPNIYTEHAQSPISPSCKARMQAMLALCPPALSGSVSARTFLMYPPLSKSSQVGGTGPSTVILSLGIERIDLSVKNSRSPNERSHFNLAAVGLDFRVFDGGKRDATWIFPARTYEVITGHATSTEGRELNFPYHPLLLVRPNHTRTKSWETIMCLSPHHGSTLLGMDIWPPGLVSTPNRDSNLDLLVIGNLVYCESSALDHAATEADAWSKASLSRQIGLPVIGRSGFESHLSVLKIPSLVPTGTGRTRLKVEEGDEWMEPTKGEEMEEGKTTLITPNQDSKPDFPVIGSPSYCKNSVQNYAATDYRTGDRMDGLRRQSCWTGLMTGDIGVRIPVGSIEDGFPLSFYENMDGGKKKESTEEEREEGRCVSFFMEMLSYKGQPFQKAEVGNISFNVATGVMNEKAHSSRQPRLVWFAVMRKSGFETRLCMCVCASSVGTILPRRGQMAEYDFYYSPANTDHEATETCYPSDYALMAIGRCRLFSIEKGGGGLRTRQEWDGRVITPLYCGSRAPSWEAAGRRSSHLREKVAGRLARKTRLPV
uniref:Uncharacterized protein n=1 Tax=Timema shepardi TaxID=629360 RepID=A0A7R9AMP1_TIMSH|nr:unnamed protein product [Timema shepardi]